ncbi:DUF4131 domain-containing protein [Paenibacillus taichungensis]
MKCRPLLVFTVCWLCGSGMACALSGWSLIVGMIGAFVCLPLLLRWIDIRGWSILLLIGALVGGAVHWEWNDARNRSSLPDITHTAAEDLEGYAATFEGTLMSDVRIDGDRADFEMQVTSMLSLSDASTAVVSEAGNASNLRERLMVQVRLAEEEEQQVAAGWKRGDSIALTGALALPGEARNFGGFDYRHSGENHKEVPVTIDVLKVAHHGSKTSSTEAWLQYWNASASVISAGANNTYGHPNPGVLERLVDSGTEIYRTDRMGEIQMRIKDGEIDVRYKLVPNSS